jgi:hypothetical protein
MEQIEGGSGNAPNQVRAILHEEKSDEGTHFHSADHGRTES